MKRKYLFFILPIIVIGIIAFYYYKMNYIDTATEYYRLVYTPPVKREVVLSSEYTDPKFEIQRTDDYINDSDAILKETKLESTCLKNTERYINQKIKNTGNSDMDKIAKCALVEILRERMARKLIIFRFSHRSGYDAKDIYRYLESNHGDISKMKEYCEENNISFAFYQL